ncbi:MAG TPA: TolC family protein [Candidatus Baltobacteraceae bacterium]|nr:TolC family protein [Candidatus Baltobacteraceae bacterium]
MTVRLGCSWAILAFAALLLAVAPARAQTGGSPPPGASSPGPVPAPMATQGDYSGSVPSAPVQGVLKLSLQEAMDRGLQQNLGLLLSGQDVRTARGQRWQQLSALLPNLTTSSYVDASQVDLAEFGFSFKFPAASGIVIPPVVGPFAYYDSRAYVTQTLLDFKAINNTHSASQSLKSAQYTYKDARDLVILAVGNTYLQAVADQARVETADAQVKTAEALYDQAADQVKAGTSPSIDALRANVELKTRQQDLIQSKNNFAIAKLTVARVIGLAPGQQFELTDDSLYQPFAGLTVDEALQRAYANRSDFQAALADVHSAEYAQKAAHDGYLPTLSFSADYGLAGTYDGLNTHGVMDVRGTLNIPIFQGGRVHGDVLEADARLEQSRERLDNLHAQIDDDVRTALFNIESAEEQVAVARSNIDLAEQTLAQSRDRFAAGVTDTVEVVQAEEAVASAHESYIASLYADNYAKISLARALGQGEQGVKEYLKGK